MDAQQHQKMLKFFCCLNLRYQTFPLYQERTVDRGGYRIWERGGGGGSV